MVLCLWVLIECPETLQVWHLIKNESRKHMLLGYAQVISEYSLTLNQVESLF